MEDVSRAVGALLPPDLPTWPKPARRLLRALVNLPTWKEHGFALCTDEVLAEWFDVSTRSVRRWLSVASERAEVKRVFVERGDALPNGQAARRRLSMLVAGDAHTARRVGVAKHVTTESADKNVRLTRTERPPHLDNLTGDRSIDLQKFKTIDQAHLHAAPPQRAAAPTHRAASTPRSTFVETNGEAATGDEHAAHAIATHYANAAGKRWRFVHPDILALVLEFVREMHGDEEQKIRRASAVVDMVCAQQRAKGDAVPTPRFVFHRQIFWKHLEEVDGLRREGPPVVPVTVAAQPPPSPQRTPAPLTTSRPKPPAAVPHVEAEDAPVDVATIEAFVARLEAQDLEPSPVIARLPPSPPAPVNRPSDGATLEVLARGIGRRVEPPVRERERDDERAPLSRAPLRNMREAARYGPEYDAFKREAEEMHERELVERRREQLRQAHAWLALEQHEGESATGMMTPPRAPWPHEKPGERKVGEGPSAAGRAA